MRQAPKLFHIPRATLHDKMTGRRQMVVAPSIVLVLLAAMQGEETVLKYLEKMDEDYDVVGVDQKFDLFKDYFTKVKQLSQNPPLSSTPIPQNCPSSISTPRPHPLTIPSLTKPPSKKKDGIHAKSSERPSIYFNFEKQH